MGHLLHQARAAQTRIQAHQRCSLVQTRWPAQFVPKEDRGRVFNERINGVKIRVETQKSKSRSTQCHRCQLFGHSQAKCTAQPKCVKCAGDHLTSTCTKPKDTAATCANCKESHTASYQGCPKHPKHLRVRKLQPAPPGTFRWGTQNNARLTAQPSQQRLQVPQPDIMALIQGLQQQMNSITQGLLGGPPPSI